MKKPSVEQRRERAYEALTGSMWRSTKSFRLNFSLSETSAEILVGGEKRRRKDNKVVERGSSQR